MPLKVFRRQSAAEKKQKRKDSDGKVGAEEKAKPEAPRPRRASEAEEKAKPEAPRPRRASATRQVVPSSQELNEAIADVLRNDENALPKAIREDLLRAHPSWKLPERRVSKFVKRQKRFCGGPTKVTSPSPSPNDEAGAPDDDDDEASTLVGEWSQKAKGLVRGAGKTVRGAGSSIRNLFRNKSTNQLHRDGATTGTLETKELPDTIDVATAIPQENALGDEKASQQQNKNNKGAEQEVVGVKSETAPADADAASAVDNDNIYQDDGTDREEKRGLCTPCEGAQCIIM